MLGRTRVRLRVSECRNRVPMFYLHTLPAGLDPLSKKNALLLSPDTEVSIAPKLHSNKQISPPKNSLANNLTPVVKNLSVNGVSTESATLSKDDSSTLRVLPARLLSDIRFPRYSDSDSLAYVSRVTFAHISKKSADSFYCGLFKPLVPPANSKVAPPPPPQDSNPVLARLHSPGGPGRSASSRSGKLWIGTSERLPAGHIVFFDLPKGVDEWGLVRYAARTYETIHLFDMVKGVSSSEPGGIKDGAWRKLNVSLSDFYFVNSKYELLVAVVIHLQLPFLLALMIF